MVIRHDLVVYVVLVVSFTESCAFVRNLGVPDAVISPAAAVGINLLGLHGKREQPPSSPRTNLPNENMIGAVRPNDVSCSLSPDGNDLDDVDPSLRRFSPQITTIEKLEDFLSFLGQPEDDRLCVIKFYASWCKSCAKFGLHYKKLALEEGDKVDSDGNIVERGRVRFAEAEFAANKRLCRTLGIKRLPYVHMYKGKAGRMCDFACGPAKFQMVIDKVNEFADMSMEEAELKKKLKEGSVLGDKLVLELKEEHFGLGRNVTESMRM